MSFLYQPYAIAMAFAAGISIFVSLVLWNRYTTPGSRSLALLMLAVAEWSFTNALEMMAVGIPAKVFWSQVSYLGITSSPVFFLTFALEYSEHTEWLSRRNQIFLWVIPVVTFFLAATNQYHFLIWNSFTPSSIGDNLVIYGHGIWFWVYFAYVYSLLTVGTAALLIHAFRMRHIYRRQAIILLVGVMIPITGNVIYLSPINPIPGLDFSPICFALTGLLLAWGLFQQRLFDLVPVARDQLTDSMSDGVVVLDGQSRILDINPAARHLLWSTATSPIGQPAQALISTFPDLLARYKDVVDAQTEITVGVTNPRHLDLRLTRLPDRRGRFTGRLIVLRDITERKQVEEALRQSNSELHARNEDLDAFAHTVAHDIRNPINQSLGYAEMLKTYHATLSEPDRISALQALVEIALKMNNILDELLLLAEVRKKDIEQNELDMDSIIHEAQKRIMYLVDQCQAEIVLPSTWPIAIGYAPWIEEVWVNYISNGCKYGGHPPRLELGADLQPGGMIRFWMHDNGDGICPDDQKQLFTPFTRLDQVRARGHGLGLSIVRRIIEKLGGQVGVESEGRPGLGSTFFFTIPAAPHPDEKSSA